MKAKFQYKCRLCNEIFDDQDGDANTIRQVFLATIYDWAIQIDPGDPHKPMIVDLHAKCRMGCGVADLIGYVKVE